MNRLLLIAIGFAAVCGISGILVLTRPALQTTTPAPLDRVDQTATVRDEPNAAPHMLPKEVPSVAAVLPPSAAPTLPGPSPAEPNKPSGNMPKRADKAVPANQRARPAKEPLKDPLARDALALVGVDPGAEQYWYGAINDPALSAHERQDLIEDLNEGGLSDPKHPAPEDLPVILNRIRLVEQTAPYAMDQVNADAFQEAYNDLLNLASLAMGDGEPVR